MCHATKKAGDHTVSIFTGRKTQLFHTCIAPRPLLQSTPFLHYSCPPSRVRHTANLINLQQPFAKYGHSKFHFNFFVFSSYIYHMGAMGASISFRTLCKNCYKMQTCNSIASIFDTNEECVTVDTCTTFVVNLRSIQGVMSIYSQEKRSNVCHSNRINQV